MTPRRELGRDIRVAALPLAYAAVAGLAGWALAAWHAPERVVTFVEAPVLGAPAGQSLLSDPYLLLAADGGLHVRWLSAIPGGRHEVLIAPNGDAGREHPPPDALRFAAATRQVSRVFEDPASPVVAPPDRVRQRLVWRHDALLPAQQSGPEAAYWVRSIASDGTSHFRGPFALAGPHTSASPVKILMTSDFQQKTNALPAFAAAAELGPFSAVIVAGDLVQHPRRASHWIGAGEAGPPGFFTALQGRAGRQGTGGGAILQHAPLLAAVGNHEVSGRFRPNAQPPGRAVPLDLAAMFNDPQPRWVAPLIAPDLPVADASHDAETFRALFATDDGPTGAEPVGSYARRVGDVFVVVLDVSRIWRSEISGSPQRRGKFDEASAALQAPEEWGFGEFLFTRLDGDSAQIRWLGKELSSEVAQTARYRVVVLHQSAFGLGANSVPVLTDPDWIIDAAVPGGGDIRKHVSFPSQPADRRRLFEGEIAPLLGRLTALRYEYPKHRDRFAAVLAPILQDGRVDLVLAGHSHIWNRFRDGRMHLLETSNLGNCYGAFWRQPDGRPWRGARRLDTPRMSTFWEEVEAGLRNAANYPRTGDPQGREPIFPSIFNPMRLAGESDIDLPFVCSDRLGVFSVLDSGAGFVRSYVIDTARPDQPAREFDRFRLGGGDHNP